MADDEPATKRPRCLPFPLYLNEDDYYSAILVQSDDDSELARQFRYLTRAVTEFSVALEDLERDDERVCLLEIAAVIGDFEFLDAMRQRFGGVIYQHDVARTALDHGHREWFMRFVELAKPTCVLADLSDDEAMAAPTWASARDMPLSAALADFEMVRYLCENVLVAYPPHRQMLRYLSAPADASHFDPIPQAAMLVSYWPSYPDFTEKEADLILSRLIIGDSFLDRRIMAYFIEERGLRFTEFHVRLAAVEKRRALYEYVLSNLEDALDSARLRQQNPLLTPSDSELFAFACRTFDRVLRQESRQRADLVDLVCDRPELGPRLKRLMGLLKVQDVSADPDLVRDVLRTVQSYAGQTATDPNVYAHELAVFTNEIVRSCEAPTRNDIIPPGRNWILPETIKRIMRLY